MKDQNKTKRINKLKIDSHRGKDGTDFGLHSRVPLVLNYLNANELLVIAYIDIDQFLDTEFKRRKNRRPILISDFVTTLGISKDTVSRTLKTLEAKEVITINRKKNSGNEYFSNMLKLHIKYQIITSSFIARLDLSPKTKAFILKVIMLGEYRINNIRNISALVKETGMQRRAINVVMAELIKRNYIADHPTDIMIQVLDVEGIMLDSEERLWKEHREMREKIAVYETFNLAETDIVKDLEARIVILLAKIDELQNGKSENNQNT